MRNKKTFMSLILILCLLVSATLVLSSCGKSQDNTEYTISSEHWDNAIGLKDEDGNYYMNIEITTKIKRRDKEDVHYRRKSTENSAYFYNSSTVAENIETCWINENGKGVVYTKKNAESDWIRSEEETEYEDFIALSIASDLADFASYNSKVKKFEYNEKDNMYHGAYLYSAKTERDVAFKFEYGKLVKVVLTDSRTDGTSVIPTITTYEISYGNAVIIIPTIESEY